MRDEHSQTPFLIFTPTLSEASYQVEDELNAAGIPFKVVYAIGDETKQFERKCFLVETHLAYDFVRNNGRVKAYLSFDAYRVCSYISKVPEEGSDEGIGTLEPEPVGLVYEDAKYRFRSQVNGKPRTYVVR